MIVDGKARNGDGDGPSGGCEIRKLGGEFLEPGWEETVDRFITVAPLGDDVNCLKSFSSE